MNDANLIYVKPEIDLISSLFPEILDLILDNLDYHGILSYCLTSFCTSNQIQKLCKNLCIKSHGINISDSINWRKVCRAISQIHTSWTYQDIFDNAVGLNELDIVKALIGHPSIKLHQCHFPKKSQSETHFYVLQFDTQWCIITARQIVHNFFTNTGDITYGSIQQILYTVSQNTMDSFNTEISKCYPVDPIAFATAIGSVGALLMCIRNIIWSHLYNTRNNTDSLNEIIDEIVNDNMKYINDFFIEKWGIPSLPVSLQYNLC